MLSNGEKKCCFFTSSWSVKLPLSWEIADIELTETDIPGVTLEEPLESATFFVMELKFPTLNSLKKAQVIEK